MSRIKKCRMCKSENIFKFLDLGYSPPSDNFLTNDELENEVFYPLDVFSCRNCGLCQLGYVVPPNLMFNEKYPYESSTTKTGQKHFYDMAENICKKIQVPKNSLIVDAGSNVGVLLSKFKEQGMKVVGVEPSSNIAKTAKKNGIDTIVEFFSTDTAKKIVEEYGHAYILTGTNVFAHINDLDNFANAADILLNEKGVIVIEAPFLGDMLENLEYDTIYHEHLSYLSLKPMLKFFERFSMEVFDVEKQTIHGGTLRYYIGRKNSRQISKNIVEFLNYEEAIHIYAEDRLKKFANDAQQHRKQLVELLFKLKKQGKRIVGISAPAKGNTLLNFCKIGPELIDYLTEKAELKIGKFSPGMHIPIYSDEKIIEDKPDYALILAWNFAEEIMNNLEKFKADGGKFIIPIPNPKIV